MKKLIATLTSLFVLVSLTACGGSGSSAAQSGAPAPVVSSSAKSKSEASPQPKAEEAVVEKQVLVDQEAVSYTHLDVYKRQVLFCRHRNIRAFLTIVMFLNMW